MAYDIVVDSWNEEAKKRLDSEFGALSILNYDGSFGDFSCLIPYKDRIKKLKVSSLLPKGHVIQKLDGLQYLAVTEDKPSLDFSKFKYLEGLAVEWDKKYSIESLYDLNLSFLSIRGWPSIDCSGIGNIKTIQVLGLEGGAFRSADGLDRLINLKSVGFGPCRYLSDIDCLLRCENLEEIELTSIPLINDVSILGDIKKLKKIEIDKIGKNCVIPDICCFYGLTVIEAINITNVVSSVDWNIIFGLKFLKNIGLVYIGGVDNDFPALRKIATDKGRVISWEGGLFRLGKKSRYSVTLA